MLCFLIKKQNIFCKKKLYFVCFSNPTMQVLGFRFPDQESSLGHGIESPNHWTTRTPSHRRNIYKLYMKEHYVVLTNAQKKFTKAKMVLLIG